MRHFAPYSFDHPCKLNSPKHWEFLGFQEFQIIPRDENKDKICAKAWNSCEYMGMFKNGSGNYLEFLGISYNSNTDNKMPWNF